MKIIDIKAQLVKQEFVDCIEECLDVDCDIVSLIETAQPFKHISFGVEIFNDDLDNLKLTDAITKFNSKHVATVAIKSKSINGVWICAPLSEIKI